VSDNVGGVSANLVTLQTLAKSKALIAVNVANDTSKQIIYSANFNPNYNDGSVILNGNAQINANQGKDGSDAMYFDGTNSFIVLNNDKLNFGVQDFDPEVQKAVHRIQPAEQVFDLVASARKIGFESVNVDLIYGLPKQTPESFDRTLQQVNALRPDRIALYAYAHLPARFKPQRRILSTELPVPSSKIAMLSRSMDALMNAGYVYVGMDHFALPEDALAVAKRQGRLHRNFQGYSTQPDCDLLGLGVSAIGRTGGTYSQNAKTMAEYVDMLDSGQLPIVKGLALSRDDLIRRAWIMAIMCQGHVQYEAFNEAWLIDAKKYFAAELSQLEGLQSDGLVALTDGGLQVTAMGWFFVRGVAMVFDKYLQADRNRARFSKII
jgi:oxygen-independent coproporphyrinogen-3 oxidase